MSTVIKFSRNPEEREHTPEARKDSGLKRITTAFGQAGLSCVRAVLKGIGFICLLGCALAFRFVPIAGLFSLIATLAMWVNEHNTSWHDPWVFWLPFSAFLLTIPTWFLCERATVRLQEINTRRKASYLKDKPDNVFINL